MERQTLAHYEGYDSEASPPNHGASARVNQLRFCCESAHEESPCCRHINRIVSARYGCHHCILLSAHTGRKRRGYAATQCSGSADRSPRGNQRNITLLCLVVVSHCCAAVKCPHASSEPSRTFLILFPWPHRSTVSAEIFLSFFFSPLFLLFHPN